MSKSNPDAEEKWAENVYECVECGKTVILRTNPFNPTKYTDTVYCPCEPQGMPMVRKYPDAGEDDETEDEPKKGDIFAVWDEKLTAPRGACKVWCLDCGHEETYRDQGGVPARRRAERAKSGHANKGCDTVLVVDRT